MDKRHAGLDIYVGCGSSPQSWGPRKRCRADLIAGIPGLWLDLDVKHPVHKQKNLPETEEDVQAVLSCFPMKPTIDIHSGHGRQFWWALSEFRSFESVEERMRAANLMQRFNVLFRNHAKSLGFALDMTFDLARIMRIPGTMNYKSIPVPVKMLSCSDARYHICDIEMYVPEMALPAILSSSQVATVHSEHFILNPMAEPPASKLYALGEAEPLFKASWEMKRKFPSGKESGSEYDMSLAAFALQADWSWQETVNLLIAFRRTNGLKPKTVIEGDPGTPLRGGYYSRTLSMAQRGAGSSRARGGG